MHLDTISIQSALLFIHQSATLRPPPLRCVDPAPLPINSSLTCWGMDFPRPSPLPPGSWHQNVSSTPFDVSDLWVGSARDLEFGGKLVTLNWLFFSSSYSWAVLQSPRMGARSAPARGGATCQCDVHINGYRLAFDAWLVRPDTSFPLYCGAILMLMSPTSSVSYSSSSARLYYLGQPHICC